MFHNESSERLTGFRERGERQPLLVETADSRILTYRLQETRPRSLIELLVRPLVETQSQREIRHGVFATFTEYEARLQADFEKTRSYLETAREIVVEQTAERSLLAGREMPAANIALTPKQAMTLEIHAERLSSLEEQDRIRSVARGSIESYFDSFSQARSPERDETREVASGHSRGR